MQSWDYCAGKKKEDRGDKEAPLKRAKPPQKRNCFWGGFFNNGETTENDLVLVGDMEVVTILPGYHTG